MAHADEERARDLYGRGFRRNRVPAEQDQDGAYQSTPNNQPCDEACTKLRLDQALTNWNELLKINGDFDNVTAGQLVAGLDAMYADYRNRAVGVADILSVVMWGIKGVDQKVIDGRLAYLRGQR